LGNPLRDTSYWLQAGQACLDGGDPPGAERALRAALALDPRCVPALYNLGNLLLGKGEARDAAGLFEKVLAVRPGFAGAWQNLGRALLDLGQPREAERAYLNALDIDPSHAQTRFNLGVARLASGDAPGARARFRQALDLDPGLVDAAINLACLHLDAREPAEALEMGRRAVALAPGDAAAHNTLGAVLESAGAHGEAAAAYRRAVDLDPGSADMRFNLATALLRLGQWEEGWRAYRARLATDCCPPRDPVAPEWDGAALDGRRLLVLAEQGLGDTLQFCRYLSALPGAGEVVFLVQPGLGEVLQPVAGATRVLEGDLRAPIPAGLGCDVQVHLLSLPGLLGTRPGNVPARVPYLQADASRMARFAQGRGPGDGLRVGLIHAGNPGHRRDRERSCPYGALAPLLGIPGVRFHSFQQGAGRDAGADGVTDLAPRCRRVEDLAAALATMDLVLSVDSMPAHLAGALGVPVWLLLDAVPDWRWMVQGDTTPWYPSMRLYRQPAPGAWGEVIEAVGRDLAERAQGSRPASAAPSTRPVRPGSLSF